MSGEKMADAKAIPIIAVMANRFTDDVQKCRKAGMNGHFARLILPKKPLCLPPAPVNNTKEARGRND